MYIKKKADLSKGRPAYNCTTSGYSSLWFSDFVDEAKFKSAFLLTFFGAENETRTRDPNLGKVVLYQLSYFRR